MLPDPTAMSWLRAVPRAEPSVSPSALAGKAVKAERRVQLRRQVPGQCRQSRLPPGSRAGSGRGGSALRKSGRRAEVRSMRLGSRSPADRNGLRAAYAGTCAQVKPRSRRGAPRGEGATGPPALHRGRQCRRARAGSTFRQVALRRPRPPCLDGCAGVGRNPHIGGQSRSGCQSPACRVTVGGGVMTSAARLQTLPWLHRSWLRWIFPRFVLELLGSTE